MSKKDYYEVLGVAKTATEKEIKTAYRKLAMKYHPDKLKDGTSDEKMKELNEAYGILSDPEKRKIYDNYGADAANGRGFAGAGANYNGQYQQRGGFEGFGGFEDIFENIFGGFSGGSRSRKASNGASMKSRGRDYKSTLSISFMDAIHGTTIKQELDKWELCLYCNGTGAENPNDVIACNECKGQGYKTEYVNSFFGQQMVQSPCEKCGGTGKIVKTKCSKCRGEKYIKVKKTVTLKVPEGAHSGLTLKLAGYGAPGHNGGEPGDMLINVIVMDHPYFRRDGLDIELDFPVSFVDIMMENTVKVPTPWGDVSIAMKKSYLDSKVIKVPQKGVKYKGMQGDLRLNLRIIIPDFDRKDRKHIVETLSTVKDNTNEKFVNKVNIG
ncbi:DnaJ C-terminal domain-containing protein [Mycoplasmopsis verecunda]|uniref:Chaperone protein DnaJ n=1 Tax=Mycoplasmopsis verecunda TaxID=171291 RepID=A0A1T4KSM9_9BACT|nr:DnaJ C-terminal domain-containing protein [Mycoplasmopsis verecunda]WPB54673.1 DnaJ domain-containing protein [Mycoplasmopsis verecunda]SJZ45350.1 molecular chaperone DnaJ [Mycoplasmopsis verecunda]